MLNLIGNTFLCCVTVAYLFMGFAMPFLAVYGLIQLFS